MQERKVVWVTIPVQCSEFGQTFYKLEKRKNYQELI